MSSTMADSSSRCHCRQYCYVPRLKTKYCLLTFLLTCVALNLTFVVVWFGKQEFIVTSSAPVVIGHVVSLIKCSKSASVTGFLDAAAVLRHSIHLTSIHNNHVSKYSYQMYAIIHTDCQSHAPVLQKLGYMTLIKDSPVMVEDIKPGWYKDNVEKENCCGSKEFIKLYAYELTQHPVVVHWDMDVAVLQPMDDLYDSMLLVDSRDARKRLEVQFPFQSLPKRIDAFFTRDITSAEPWDVHQGVQGGFLVARPNKAHLQRYIDIIKDANYTSGRSPTSGWGQLGYGGFQGAMAYQGIVAYFYDQIVPNTAVELDVCRWNQVVADVLWRGPGRKDEFHLKCRQMQSETCEDCRVTPVEETKTVHYTACRKPWECTLPYPRKTRSEAQQYRVNNLTNTTTCGKLFSKWFDLRHDFEERLQTVAGVVPPIQDGTYEPLSFLGYCKSRGQYIPMNPPPDDFDISKLYRM